MSNRGVKIKKDETRKRKYGRRKFALLTLICAVTSFLTKEVLKDPAKDIASAIKTQHERFEQNAELNVRTAQRIADSTLRQSELLQRGDLAYDSAIQQSVSDVRELRAAMDGELNTTRNLVSVLFLNTYLEEGVQKLEKDKKKSDEFCDNTLRDAYDPSQKPSIRWLGLEICQATAGTYMVIVAAYSDHVLQAAAWEENLLDRVITLLTIVATISGLATLVLAWYTGHAVED